MYLADSSTKVIVMLPVIEVGLSLGVLITLILLIAGCICGCRNSNQKSELVGTAGVLKLHCEEDIPSPGQTTPVSIKRASAQNSQRSLPEIPHPVARHDSGDTASEIYATVNLDQSVNNEISKAETATTEHPYEHAYAKLQNETQRLMEVVTENQLIVGNAIEVARPSSSNSVDMVPNPDAVLISAGVAISGQLPSSQELPYITPPSPQNTAPNEPNPPTVNENVQHFSGDSTDSTKGYTSISVREPLSQIRATLQQKTQPHYATVSDDSDEMYAAIDEASQAYTSGSETYAQIQPTQPAPHAVPERESTPSQSTAHEDVVHRNAFLTPDINARRSAPAEASLTSNDSSHSRQASASSCSNSMGTLGSPKPEKRQANSPLPPPPGTGHAASSGTLTSLEAKEGKGKKVHESPLYHTKINSRQQRISSTGDLHVNDKTRRSLNEKHQRNNSCVSSSDFYGCNYPVDKHRFSSGDLARPLVAKELNFDIDSKVNDFSNVDNNDQVIYNSIDSPSDYSSVERNSSSLTSEQRITESPSRNVEEMYAKVMKKGKIQFNHQMNERSHNASRLSNYEEFDNQVKQPDNSARVKKGTIQNTNDVSKLSAASDDPGYETIDRKANKTFGYETITEKKILRQDSQDPGYETVKEPDKLMATVLSKLDNIHTRRFAESGPESILSSDPGYEHISKGDSFLNDSDPNYEVLRNQPPTPPYATIASNYQVDLPTYSVINKKSNKFPDWPLNNNENLPLEPNYESMPHEPLYTTGSESDPNYESVRPKDPNYESVKYFEMRMRDPPYEKVQNDSLDNAKGSESVHRSDSGAGYEKLKPVLKPDERTDNANTPSANGVSEVVVDDYFNV